MVMFVDLTNKSPNLNGFILQNISCSAMNPMWLFLFWSSSTPCGDTMTWLCSILWLHHLYISKSLLQTWRREHSAPAFQNPWPRDLLIIFCSHSIGEKWSLTYTWIQDVLSRHVSLYTGREYIFCVSTADFCYQNPIHLFHNRILKAY